MSQGVRVWCDGKQYTPQQSSATASSDSEGGISRPANEVLLPFARAEGRTALVVAAQLPGASGAAAGKECVVLMKDFRCAVKSCVCMCLRTDFEPLTSLDLRYICCVVSGMELGNHTAGLESCGLHPVCITL